MIKSKREFSKCIMHLYSGKTYILDFPEGETVKNICLNILPLVPEDEDEIENKINPYILEQLGDSYVVVKIKGGGNLVINRYEILGLEFIEED